MEDYNGSKQGPQGEPTRRAGTDANGADPSPTPIQRTDRDLFFGQLVRVAGDTPGKLVLAGIREGSPIDIRHVMNGPNAETTLQALLEVVDSLSSTPGTNVYVNVALMRADLPAGKKGSEEDVIGVLAAVLDFDGKHDGATRGDRVPLVPHMEVWTSAGNYQLWWWFDRPYPVADAKPVITALARCAGTDSTTSGEHLFRVPDTLNWPTQKKIDAGRDPEPYRVRIRQADFTVGKGISLEFFAATTPLPRLYQSETLPGAIMAKWPDAFDRAATERESTGGPAGDFDWDQPQPGTARGEVTDEALAKALDVEAPGRSEALAKAINILIYAGYTPNEAVEQMMAHSDAPAFGHYPDEGTEAALKKDVKRLFTKPNPNTPEARLREQMAKDRDRGQGQKGDTTAGPGAEDTTTGPQPKRRRFKGYTPQEGAALPDLDYFDKDKTLPIVPGGCHGTVVGKKASHKTGVAMKKGLDAIFEKGARVLYIAGEGGHGIAKIRLQRHLEARGKTLDDIEGHWITCPVSPNLTKPSDIAEIIEEYRDFDPDLVFVDTLTRATAGVDINSPQAGTDVTEGSLQLATGFNATVGLIGHPPLSGGERTLGSVLIPDHAFFNWLIEFDKASGIVTQRLINMKDGPDDFSIYLKIEMVRGVPVVVDCGPDDKKPAAGGKRNKTESENLQFRHDILLAIKDHAATNGGGEILLSDLARWMVRNEAEDHREDAFDTLERRLQRHVPTTLRDLMVSTRRGNTVIKPYRFKKFAEIGG